MRLATVLYVTGTLVRLFARPRSPRRGRADLRRDARCGRVSPSPLPPRAILGITMRRASGGDRETFERLRRVEGLTVVAATWMLVAIVAAIPYMWSGLGFVDALFESMSGLTTTGATVFTDFGMFGRSVFFWRALTHWLGGVGVIALFIAVLPRLAIGGRELFFAEAAGPTDEKLTPQLRHTAIALWKIYGALTAAQVVALMVAGMSLYDAICHAFATMAAGGFSPHPQSIAGYQSPAIDWVTSAFMFVAGANFALQYRAVQGSRNALVQDEEFRAYTGVVVVASIVLAIALLRQGMGYHDAVRHSVFQVLSILTTTGFASHDFISVERPSADGAVPADVHRRLRRLGGRRARRSCAICCWRV